MTTQSLKEYLKYLKILKMLQIARSAGLLRISNRHYIIYFGMISKTEILGYRFKQILLKY